MPRKGKRFPQAATPDSLARPTEAARDAEPSAADDSRLPNSSVQDNPASDVSVCRGATSDEGEQRGRKRCWNTEANEPGKIVAISDKVQSCTADSLKLALSAVRVTHVSGKALLPKDPHRAPDNCDDRGTHKVNAKSSAESRSSLSQISEEDTEASDISAFPISCSLKLHAEGFYSLCGVCCLCDRTFRAVGGTMNGKLNRWRNHAGTQRAIMKHAQMHGVVGYTPHRNLYKMRLDWTRSFPISCSLKKHHKGFYVLSGFCCLCPQKFRAVGRVMSNGVPQPWARHATAEIQMMLNARTHGVFGYTPQRNLDTMRLDWIRSQDESPACRQKRKQLGDSTHKAQKGK